MSNPGYLTDKDRLLARMNRIEGQVRGIGRMIDEETYCIDVLTQVSAAIAALKGVAVELVDDHVRHCVVDAPAEELDEKLSEAVAAIARLTRS
ncbi:MAG TPA: metal-sensitive transcriptional regulator [Acidimicrobiia bacterium]|nr:metal-sensitive transcriptional regulator [Acidimicrobiia bacterium]